MLELDGARGGRSRTEASSSANAPKMGMAKRARSEVTLKCMVNCGERGGRTGQRRRKQEEKGVEQLSERWIEHKIEMELSSWRMGMGRGEGRETRFSRGTGRIKRSAAAVANLQCELTIVQVRRTGKLRWTALGCNLALGEQGPTEQEQVGRLLRLGRRHGARTTCQEQQHRLDSVFHQTAALNRRDCSR